MLDGKELEEAVAPLVTAILAGSELGTRQFRIEMNKTVKPQGVPHEIDVYVTELSPGGDLIYLFECKNTKKPVDKNTVMILSKKAEAIGAKRSFLVALKFSKPARAQAKLDGIVLLDALKHRISPMLLQVFDWYVRSVTIREVVADSGPITATITTPVVFGAVQMPFSKLLTEFAKKSAARRVLQPDVMALPPGAHDVACFSKIDLPAETLMINGKRIVSVSIESPICFSTGMPTIRYGYDVAAKHIVVKYERFRVGEDQWADTITVSGP